MGKASKTKQESSRREKIAAQREAARRAERRNRLLIAGGAVIVVIAVVVAFVLVKANSNSGKASSSGSTTTAPTGAALASVIKTLTSVPTSATDTVGDGGGAVSVKPSSVSGQSPWTSGGKPVMYYEGAEYCPYCGATRWSMIVALSRFGTFSGLQTMKSAVKNGAGDAEPNPNTPTWTFLNSSFTSNYLTFSPEEVYTNIPDPSTGEYTSLQTPTKTEDDNVSKVNGGSSTISFPFIDYGNKYTSSGSVYDPGVLAGLSWATIAADLSKPSSPVAQAVDGAANYMTAAICKLTNNLPASACTSTIQGLQSQI
jgi:hypothetical protein